MSDESKGGVGLAEVRPFAPGLDGFLRESLMIEGIRRAPTAQEVEATSAFLEGPLTVDAVLAIQAVYAPGKPLRNRVGMDVRVGRHIPKRGSPYMRDLLADVLNNEDPHSQHVAFELLHPFLDGNGRTGRAVWAWSMIRAGRDPFAIGFLHRIYYQMLAAAGDGDD